MSRNIHAHTPEVKVLDNRGLTVRTIGYHRHPETPDVTEERITRHAFDTRGHLVTSIDPRLFARQQHDKTVKPNVSYLTNLNGDVMRTESPDAGITVSLSDIAGRPHWSKNAVGALQTWQYEADTLPGRLLSITEQPQGESARITERFVYAGHSEEEKAQNLSGQAVRHYDTAGLTKTDSIALTGTPLAVTLQLLPEGTPADWQGTQESAWQTSLSADIFTTHSTADATGATLTHTDAKGHQQRLTYDVAGLLTESGLTLKGQPEQIILKSLTWSAAGQKLREAHGNGVVTTYRYEPETQRLTAIKTERPTGHAAGAKVLQHLHYTYDPVGNVLRILDEAEPTRFWRNQKVVPENTYTYDSLYQLVKATGREKADIKNQGINPTTVSIPLATDNTAYTAWTRSYTYDAGNNLTRIRHHAAASGNTYTSEITVSHRSNRAVLSLLTKDPTQVDSLFDAGGHQTQLQPGQTLTWTARGELLKVMPVVRDGQAADAETYRYDATRQRVIKTTVQQTGNSRQTQQVVYLPNLELRTTHRGETLKEALQVITVGEAGRAQVRVLHWEAGKPDGINNHQLRYSYDNLIGSSTLELDGAGEIISLEEYYPYGGTAVWSARNQIEANYKTRRYSGKERDATGLYYYGYRYYQPWVGRWLSADPAGTADGLNLYPMVGNNPVTLQDRNGLVRVDLSHTVEFHGEPKHDTYFNNIEKSKKESFFAAEIIKTLPEDVSGVVDELSKELKKIIENINNIDDEFIKFLEKDIGQRGQYGRIRGRYREIVRILNAREVHPQTFVKRMLLIKSYGAYIIDHASKDPEKYGYLLNEIPGYGIDCIKLKYKPRQLFDIRGRKEIVEKKEKRVDSGILDTTTFNSLSENNRNFLTIPGLKTNRPLFRMTNILEGEHKVKSPFVSETFDMDYPMMASISGSTSCIMVGSTILMPGLGRKNKELLAKASVAFLVGGGYHSATEVLRAAYPNFILKEVDRRISRVQ